jgi:hypothetical protein
MIAPEIEPEIGASGLRFNRLLAVEGPGWMNQQLDAWLDDDIARERMLEVLRRLETEPSLIGVSAPDRRCQGPLTLAVSGPTKVKTHRRSGMGVIRTPTRDTTGEYFHKAFFTCTTHRGTEAARDFFRLFSESRCLARATEVKRARGLGSCRFTRCEVRRWARRAPHARPGGSRLHRPQRRVDR